MEIAETSGTYLIRWSMVGCCMYHQLPTNTGGIVVRGLSVKFSWINSLWTSAAIWRHSCRSTLVQLMAWCLAAPSHYLNQCWLIINKVQWYSADGNFTRDNSAINHRFWFENYLSKNFMQISQGQWVKTIQHRKGSTLNGALDLTQSKYWPTQEARWADPSIM